MSSIDFGGVALDVDNIADPEQWLDHQERGALENVEVAAERRKEGHARIWPNRIWPEPHLAKKSEFGQVIFVTAFGQTAFGQNWCS